MPGVRVPSQRVPSALQQLPQPDPLLLSAPRVPKGAQEPAVAHRVAFAHQHAPFTATTKPEPEDHGLQALAPLNAVAEPDLLYYPPGVVVYSGGRYDLLPSSSAY